MTTEQITNLHNAIAELNTIHNEMVKIVGSSHAQETNIMINKPNNETPNEGRTSGTDVGGTCDYNTIAVKTPGGKEITLRLYGR